MTRGGAPLGITPAWRAAVEAAGEQCERSGKSGRCSHTLAGGYRLYLDSDGRVYCPDHHAPTTPAGLVRNDSQQDSLF